MCTSDDSWLPPAVLASLKGLFESSAHLNFWLMFFIEWNCIWHADIFFCLYFVIHSPLVFGMVGIESVPTSLLSKAVQRSHLCSLFSFPTPLFLLAYFFLFIYTICPFWFVIGRMTLTFPCWTKLAFWEDKCHLAIVYYDFYRLLDSIY